MKSGLVRKKIYMLIGLITVMLLGGCGVEDLAQYKQESQSQMQVQTTEQKESEEENFPEEEGDSNSTEDMEKMYIGEYLDFDNGEPNLEIAKGEDGKYIVQIGIFRLASLDDGVGELTVEGMKFTATDPAGNPISGVITVEDKNANVTFTDSTWEHLENGSTFQYTKASDSPNIWNE